MNNKRDHLLYCIGEECGEIQQVVGKSGRFGMFDINPHTKNTNFVELKKEVHDLVAVYEMMCEELDENSKLDRYLIEQKKLRVIKYMKYARDVKQLKS